MLNSGGIASRRKRGLRALVAPFAPAVIVALFGIITYVGVSREAETASWVDHTHQVIELNHDLLARMIDAETGARGFIITGDSAYLQPYRGAAADIKLTVGEIRRLTADNPLQQARIDSLGPVMDRQLAALDIYVAARRRADFDSSRALMMRPGAGTTTMDVVRELLGRIESEERQLLATRAARRADRANTILWIVAVGTVLAAAFALFLDLLLSRAAKAQTRLAEQVEARAKELETANEQLQEQAAEMEAQAEELEVQADETALLNEELQTSNEELTQRTAEAEEANWVKARFLASMSHELRTPLNAIVGYVELIQLGVRGPVTPLQLDDLRRITRSSTHLLSLINDVLNFAKIEAGRVELHIADILVQSVLEEIDPLVGPQMLAKGLDYVRGECDPELYVAADREKVDQILINLLTNAIKFTARDGRIRVVCIPEDAFVRFEITDTGRGIPPEKIVVVFDPFVQVARGDGLAGDGVGLGLSISRELARAMNGDITVTSVVNDGSTFTLRLPRAKSRPPV
ncbi:MAG: CHASE3 domain-containing protein [bacterium]